MTTIIMLSLTASRLCVWPERGLFLVPEFAQTIEIAVGSIFACSMTRFDHPWAPEKIFKKLEAAGILEHYMLCAAIKQPHEETETAKDFTLKYLLTCTAFVKKRFSVGTPCGDSLRAIMDDGHMAVCPRALPYLQNLLKLSSSLQTKSENNTNLESREFCRSCYKEDLKTKLFQCSRCKQVSYCSKECQKADWPNHKRSCVSGTKRALKNAEASDQLIQDYAERHYVDIMVRLVEECEKADGGSLQMKDMVLELDFNPDSNGNVPILQEDAPQFKIISNVRYLEAEIENGYVYSENVESFAARLNDRSLSDLLCYVLYCQGTKGCCTFNFFEPHTNQAMYTEETLAAFRSALLDNNYGHLAHIFHKQDRWKHFAEKLERLRLQKSLSAGATTTTT